MREKIVKKYLRKARKLLDTKFCRGDLVKRIYTYVALLVIYSGSFLKWTREELKKNGPENKKNDNNAQDIDRLYVSRIEEGRGLASIEDSVDTSIQRLEDCIEKCRGRLITATRNNTNGTRNSRKQKWGEKQL